MTKLTGNAIVGQSGGPTAVINQSLAGVVEEARKRSEIKSIYGAIHGIQGVLKQEMVDLRAETAAGWRRIADTPSAALGSVRKKPTREECAQIFKIFQAHDIRYFFYIGGNDSAETASIVDELSQVHGYELRVCHVPKTIDNDLLETDHCPGFGSAARYVALALMGDNLDNRSLKGVKIDVVMGRRAGFLTAAATLGRRDEDDGPHYVYLPEVAFNVEKFLTDVDRALVKWGRCVVAVSEGIEDEKGNPVFTTGEVDSHNNPQLSGTGALGDFLAGLVKTRLKQSRVRADTFGYLQRCFPTIVSPVDAREARQVGVHAVRMLTSGGFRSGSVSIRRAGGARGPYKAELARTDLIKVAKNTRKMDDKLIASSGNDVTAAFARYALPLIGPLPELGRLKGKRVRARKI